MHKENLRKYSPYNFFFFVYLFPVPKTKSPLLSPSESLKKLTVSPESIKKLADFSNGLLSHVKNFYNTSLWPPSAGAGTEIPATPSGGQAPPPGFQSLPSSLPSAAGATKIPEST
jgi:hypothetical protein